MSDKESSGMERFDAMIKLRFEMTESSLVFYRNKVTALEERLSNVESQLEAVGSMMMTNGSIVCAIENRYKDIERSLKLIDECLGIHERKLNKLMLSGGVE